MTDYPLSNIICRSISPKEISHLHGNLGNWSRSIATANLETNSRYSAFYRSSDCLSTVEFISRRIAVGTEGTSTLKPQTHHYLSDSELLKTWLVTKRWQIFEPRFQPKSISTHLAANRFRHLKHVDSEAANSLLFVWSSKHDKEQNAGKKNSTEQSCHRNQKWHWLRLRKDPKFRINL